MTNHLTIYNGDTKVTTCQECVPIVKQLESLFSTIPVGELFKALKVYYAGRNGYTHKVLWRTYVAMTVLNLPSFAALIRTLQNNPYVAQVCGIVGAEGIPSRFAILMMCT